MANDLYASLQRAATSFNIVVEEPQWVEVPNPRRAADYNNGIKSDIDPKVCKIVCVVIFNPDVKKGV